MSFTYSRTEKSVRLFQYLSSDKILSKTFQFFSHEHRALEMYVNVNTSGAWSIDLVTSDRSAKNNSFYRLMKNIIIGNAYITDLFKSQLLLSDIILSNGISN